VTSRHTRSPIAPSKAAPIVASSRRGVGPNANVTPVAVFDGSYPCAVTLMRTGICAATVSPRPLIDSGLAFTASLPR
jgi:hypothetical protein